jgi:hypothetical protein
MNVQFISFTARTFMTKLGRSTTILCLVFGVLVLATSTGAQTRPPIAELVAKTYGLDSFGQVEAIRYTWNAQLSGVNLSRSWVWQPKSDQVSYEGKDKNGKPVKVTYVRSKLDGEAANVKNEIDPVFLNDQYWLLFPFHVYWDSSADVQDLGVQKLPLGKGSANIRRRGASRLEIPGSFISGLTTASRNSCFIGVEQ